MRHESAVIVMVIVLLCAAAIIVWSLTLRYRRRELQHRERMAALDKGVPLPELPPDRTEWTPRLYLRRGLVWLFLGVAITASLATLGAVTSRAVPLDMKLVRSAQMKQLGIGQEQIEAYMRQEQRDGIHPAVCVIGLIPIAVGLAYLTYYRVESSSPR